MRIDKQQARMGIGGSPSARSVEVPLRRLLDLSGGICATLAAAILSGMLVSELWWTTDPASAEAWPAHASALGTWVFVQMTALALFSAGLSRLIGQRWTP